MWRVLSSDKMSVSLLELETTWTMADVWDANEVLDMHDDAVRIANQKNK